jgi:hypothetical protein
MTTREKQWLLNIQLLQLNTSQPYIDDYYYTVQQCYMLISTWSRICLFQKDDIQYCQEPNPSRSVLDYHIYVKTHFFYKFTSPKCRVQVIIGISMFFCILFWFYANVRFKFRLSQHLLFLLCYFMATCFGPSASDTASVWPEDGPEGPKHVAIK